MTDALLAVMRRALAVALTAATMLGAAAAEPFGNPFDPSSVSIPKGYAMSSREAATYARPHLHDIAHCYREHVEPARELRSDMTVYLVVARTGRVVHSEVLAPGVRTEVLARLERCVRLEVSTWRFPRHPAFSNVTIPYWNLSSSEPASGAQPRELPNV
jgi:hypothetical protein